ncbi:hypothetical protein RRG08_028479 [Elysia crispata]|uniref:Major facilitator superfamily (MFS) profile domain-containing protein n=1 Tax=Elysia crispata TaxID=231223 RepID=A0AAE1AU73_9GAST|nr:hypothetical protein RRG08_028479 [Elysia crispata]
MGETIESIFDDLGGFGLAQWIIVTFIFYPFVAASWGMIQMAFAVMVPDWHCVELMSHDSTPQLQQDQHQQLYSNRSDLVKACAINGSACARFEFTGDKQTVVNEWSLICSHKWIPSTMISIQMGGVLIGAVMAGQTSDRWGRRKSLVLATAWHACANLMASFSPSWQLFTVCRFLIGVGLGGVYTIGFPYAMEFLPLNRRGRVAIFPGWTLGVAIYVGAAYLMPHWRYIHLACAIFSIPAAAMLFVVPESIRWLAVEGRVDEAMVAVGKVARWNGKPLPDRTRTILESIYLKKKQDSEGRLRYSYLDLFKRVYFVKCALVMCFLWASMSMISYGISFGVHGLSGNLYLNILLVNSVEIPGMLPVLWLMDRIGRKWTTVSIFCVISMTVIVVLILKLTDSDQNDRAVFVFAMITKLCIDNVWNVVQAWVSELYPTTIRALGYGVAMTSARVGGMLAPFLINLKESVVQTYLIILLLSLGVVLLSLLLPETRLSALKDSMALKPLPADSILFEVSDPDVELKIPRDRTDEERDGLTRGAVDDSINGTVSSSLLVKGDCERNVKGL